ncbi:hypothetical protein CIK06_02410 [Plantactinospora sp. KBS50]|nr:hypothetical protein CIK06_02410 [Plantactinospora sp. KBS50]
MLDRLQRLKTGFVVRLLRTIGIGIGVSIALACVGACLGTTTAPTGGTSTSAEISLSGPAEAMAVLSGIALLGTIVLAALRGLTLYLATRAVRNAAKRNSAQFTQATALWQQRREAFQSAELERIDAMVEWGAARTADGNRRLDIIGGTLWGWEAFLTVFGSSMVGTRGALTVLDLSGESVCAELVRLSSVVGAGVELQRLPTDMADSDLLVGLDRHQLVDALVESMYGDSPGGNRADRAMDNRVLTAICDVIGHDLTFARLSAALHTVMGEPGIRSELTEDERLRLADDLFSDEYRRQAHGHLRRLDSYIYPLRELGSRATAGTNGFVSCITLDSDGRNVRSELLVDLVVQWATRRMLAADPPRTLIIASADDLQRRHVERLSDICERRDIRLVLLFRHLRDASAHLLGGGAVGFMRLGNHEEAARAADFIGRQHKFVVSQLTCTLGGSESHGETETEGWAETESLNIGKVTSTFSNWGRGGSSSDGAEHSSHGSNWSRGGGSSESHSRTQGWSTTRNWSMASNRTEGTNWSNAVGQQRVYEYSVEPTTLQHLPDHVLLLVQGRPGQVTQLPVECDPSIITLPRASHEPLPPTQPVSLYPPPHPPIQQVPGHAPGPGNPAVRNYPPPNYPPPGYHPGGTPGPQYPPPQYPRSTRRRHRRPAGSRPGSPDADGPRIPEPLSPRRRHGHYPLAVAGAAVPGRGGVRARAAGAASGGRRRGGPGSAPAAGLGRGCVPPLARPVRAAAPGLGPAGGRRPGDRARHRPVPGRTGHRPDTARPARGRRKDRRTGRAQLSARHPGISPARRRRRRTAGHAPGMDPGRRDRRRAAAR